MTLISSSPKPMLTDIVSDNHNHNHNTDKSKRHDNPLDKQQYLLELESKQNEISEYWKLKQPSICCICLDNTVSESNKLLVCSNKDCDVCVHQECYGIRSHNALSQSTWLCLSCSQASINNRDADDTDVECVLCPNVGGAMKPLGNGKWIHVTCAIWHPDVKIGNLITISDFDISRINLQSWQKMCYLCDDEIGASIGACVKCSHSECQRWFHVSCGMKWNLFNSAVVNDYLKYDYFCHDHCKGSETFIANDWEVWRRKRIEFEMDIDENDEIYFDQCQRATVNGKSAFVGQMFRSRLDQALFEQYVNFDSDREFQLKQLKERNTRLIIDRRNLEIQILEIQKSRKDTRVALDLLNSENETIKSQLETIQAMLHKIYKRCEAMNIDLGFLVTENLDSNLIPPSSTILEFFIRFNASIYPQYAALEPVPLDCPLPGTLTFNEFRSLDAFCHLPRNTAPAFFAGLSICTACRTRRLPHTAPVLPKYRDYLLSCYRCDIKYHICCLPTPLNMPPVNAIKWECGKCQQKQFISSRKITLKPTFSNDEDYDQEKKRKIRKSLNDRRPTTGPSGQQYSRNRKPSISYSSSATTLGRSCGNMVYDVPETNLSVAEAREQLLCITGPSPPVPEICTRLFGVTKANDVVLRSFVFHDASAEDRERMKMIAMWRVITNIPPSADPRDVIALRMEGEQCAFGKFAKAFLASKNKEVESDDKDVEMSCCDDDHDDDYCAKPSGTIKSPSGTGGLRPERVGSRWDGDLYKPMWTRGNGKGKEGWCGLCEPGQWLKTKTSVYWYHMHNFHGISSIAGTFFAPPLDRRLVNGVKEGLCHQCKKWVVIQGDKPVNVEEIYWFKHAQKCHRFDGPVNVYNETSD